MRFLLRLTLILFGTALVLVSGLMAHVRAQHPVAPSAWIAFESTRDDGVNIYRMRFGGQNIQRLTDSFGGRSPAWSPDGEWLLFLSDRDGVGNVYRMRSDGSRVQRLTDSETVGPSSVAVWSPDGQRIALVAFADEDSRDIYLMRGDGRDLQRLTADLAEPGSPCRRTTVDRLTSTATAPQFYRMRPMAALQSLTDRQPVQSPNGRPTASGSSLVRSGRSGSTV
jgi:Tol biopolymer transport system component